MNAERAGAFVPATRENPAHDDARGTADYATDARQATYQELEYGHSATQ